MDDLELLLMTFRQESDEMIDRLAELVEIIGTDNKEERTEAFTEAIRIVHNLKGVASSVGLDELESFAHAFEDSLVEMKKSDESLSGVEINNLLDKVTEIQRLAEGGLSAEVTRQTLKEITEDPPAKDQDQQDLKTHEMDTLGTERPNSGLPTANPERKSDVLKEYKNNKIRVDSQRLDRLMTHAGESMITHSRMYERHKELEVFQEVLNELASQPEADRQTLIQLSSAMQKIVRWDRQDMEAFGHLTQNISDAVKRMRMTPLQELAPLIRRTVRETANDLDKSVKLHMDLGNIELDRTLLDHLKDPLLHLLRNAIDHGIESNIERAKADKPEQGQIRVHATMERSFARIEVSDDGRGLNLKQIARSAISRGLVDEEQVKRMDKEEILSFIFSAFFSTALRVSKISGRGVGLSVVKQEMEKAGGRAEIAVEPTMGGTTFYLTMPLNVLSIDGLLVRASGQIYAIPIDQVNRIVYVSSEGVRYIDGSPVIANDDLEPTKIFWLSQLISKHQQKDDESMKILILERGSRRLGLVVQDIIGEKEFIIERLPWNLVRVPFINGAIKMSDGSVALSLDVALLFDSTYISRRDFTRQALIKPSSGSRILVVDDSLTVRTLHRNILSAAGYDVSVCVNGKEAWDMLTQEPYDLLISDINMPEMDGYELTKKVRNTQSLKHIPVILVTNLGQSGDKERGLEAGAEEYIIKGKYNHDQFISTVNRLIER